MTINKEINSAIILSKDKKELLGIKTGLTVKGTTRSEFSDIRFDSGYILNEGAIEEFNFTELAEVDNKVIIYSENISWGLKPFFTDNNDIDNMIELLSFLNMLDINNIKIEILSLNQFYRNENNQIFILPPRIIRFLNDRGTLKQSEYLVERYKHPELTGSESTLYSIGILLFEIATNSYPYIYKSVEDLRDKVRRKKYLKPRWENVFLSDRFNSLILNLLNDKSEMSLKTTLDELKQIKTEGLYRELKDKDNKEKLNSRKKSMFLKVENFRFSLIKNSSKLVIGAVVFAIVTAFASTIIINSLRPPITEGYSKEEIVFAYFYSYNSVDVDLIEDVLKDGVRDRDVKEITSLHITLAYRGSKPEGNKFLGSEEWLELSDEEKNVKDVFAYENIKINRIDENSFSVTYDKWYSVPEENESIDDFKLSSYKKSIEEIFTLGETEYSYEIIKIETISEQETKVW